MNTRFSSFILLLIGIFSHTQIYVGGAIGISELFIFSIAPFVFLIDFPILRKDGFLPLVLLVLASLLGCYISCRANHVAFAYETRGLMANYGLFACIVVMHRLLRDNLMGVRWLLLGIAISMVVSTFVFHGATEFVMYAGGDEKHAAEGIIRSPLFWTTRLGSFWVLPVSGWYMSMPQFWNWLSLVIWGIVSAIISQGSGRSSALTMLAGAFLIYICGKSQRRIFNVTKHIGFLFVGSILFLFVITSVYRFTASRGLLGEKSQLKYERQVLGKKTPLQVLMSGRSEFFVGLFACLKRPIVGYGPWPIDTNGIYEEWLKKYGSAEDVHQYYEYQEYCRKNGFSRYYLIPSHSVIIQFWLWYGIFGLILWLYILYRIWRYFKYDMPTIPHYVGYLAAWLPIHLWNILFSPFSGRIEYGAFLSALLLCETVRKGIVRLPNNMVRDIMGANGK